MYVFSMRNSVLRGSLKFGTRIPQALTHSSLSAVEMAHTNVRLTGSRSVFSRLKLKPNSSALLNKVRMAPEFRNICLLTIDLMGKREYVTIGELRADFKSFVLSNKIPRMPPVSTISRVVQTLEKEGVLIRN